MMFEILQYIRNFFLVKDGIHKGSFVCSSGSISDISFIASGQYFRIKGSLFNDGVYKNTTEGMASIQPEMFIGEVWALAIPKEIISLESEISAWCTKYNSAVQSPYNSESFGGYSYSKGDAASGASWQAAFRLRLNGWRKI